MNRLTVGVLCALGLVSAAGQLEAQDPPAVEEFRAPACDLDMGHFLVRQAMTYLTGAVEEADPAAKEALLRDAQQSLVEAINTDQAENPSVWYLLARHGLLTGDLVGADSAFARVADVAPLCGEDIEYYRHSSWVRAVNRGIDMMQSIDYDGALVELAGASAIWRGANVALFYMGSIYAEYGEADSALYYFKEVVELGNTDSSRVANYNTAVENIATLYHMIEQWDSTIVWYEKALEINPENTDLVFGLAEAYAESGDDERAFTIYDGLLANPAEMNSLDLFNAGVKLFNADEFTRASTAFNAGLESNPYHRDALYNLSNTYLAMANDDGRPQSERDAAVAHMGEIATRLIAVDSQNRDPRRLHAAALQLAGDPDGAVAIMDEMNAFTYEVSVDISRPISGGYELHGRLTNLADDAETATETLTFEFMNGAGDVVGTDTVAGETLAAGASTRFSLGAVGEEIVAWRYRVGS
ncbi:tetratricopeptide repeat protein [Gemmatimonadota bacterium]